MPRIQRSSLNWTHALFAFIALSAAAMIGCGSGGGGGSTSPYGSTLVVQYYSDSGCNSELPLAGSRFAITSSGESSCNQHSSYGHVALSVDPTAISCDPANSASCGINDGATVEWRGGCDSSCSSCQNSTPSDPSYALGECVPVLTTLGDSTTATNTGTYLKVSTSEYTGGLYLGVSERTGSSIKMYDPATLDSIYLDQSGNSVSNYPRSLAVSESDIANGYTNVLYSALTNNILWQCSSDAANSCGTWNTASSLPNTIISNGQGLMFVGLKSGEIWQCPTSSANSCTTFATLSDSVISLAYDAGSNTLFAGTGCKDCPTAKIYQFPNLSPTPTQIYEAGGDFNECVISIEDMEFGGGQLWATNAAECQQSTDSDGDVITTYRYTGQLIACKSGSCTMVDAGAPYWGVTYDSDHNLIFAGQVGHCNDSSSPGLIRSVNASSDDAPTTFANLGTLGEGVIPNKLFSMLPAQALIYAQDNLWIGTGNTDCASCNSLFRCPVTGDNSNPSCSQVNLDCQTPNTCLGAQSLTYIASVNYP